MSDLALAGRTILTTRGRKQAGTAPDYELDVVVQPDKSTIPDLVAAIVEYFGSSALCP